MIEYYFNKVKEYCEKQDNCCECKSKSFCFENLKHFPNYWKIKSPKFERINKLIDNTILFFIVCETVEESEIIQSYLFDLSFCWRTNSKKMLKRKCDKPIIVVVNPRKKSKILSFIYKENFKRQKEDCIINFKDLFLKKHKRKIKYLLEK